MTEICWENIAEEILFRITCYWRALMCNKPTPNVLNYCNFRNQYKLNNSFSVKLKAFAIFSPVPLICMLSVEILLHSSLFRTKSVSYFAFLQVIVGCSNLSDIFTWVFGLQRCVALLNRLLPCLYVVYPRITSSAKCESVCVSVWQPSCLF